MKLYLLFLAIAVSAPDTNAQQLKRTPIPADLIQFFQGNWNGEGKFSNGRPISASLKFQLTLDSAWLVCEHIDKAPSTYKANLYWGTDLLNGNFTAYAFDNSHGHRQFSSEGWKENKLILYNEQEIPGRGKFIQHFIYEKQDDTTFKMTYETSKDGKEWRMIDYLVFKKQGNHTP
jgi:hypothetical protein